MKYKALANLQIWRAVILGLPIGKRDILNEKTIVDVINSKDHFGFIETPSRGWIDLRFCIVYQYDPPPPLPPAGNIRMTIRGDRKPPGYLPEGTNLGSFDIIWAMYEQKITKPQSFGMQPEHIEVLKRLNPDNYGWLIDQAGTRKILTEENGVYRCPVPCMSGNNPVMVLEESGIFSRVAMVNIYKPIPANLPDYLCHTWYGFTTGGAYWQPKGGVKYPLYFPADSAWVQTKGLV